MEASTHITTAAIPSLFLRFVLMMKGTVLENIIVLISKKCAYFGLASLFHLIFSNNVLPCIKLSGLMKGTAFMKGK